MQKKSQSECIVCGKTDYEVCFSAGVESLLSASNEQKREILQCQCCGLLQSKGTPGYRLNGGEIPATCSPDGISGGHNHHHVFQLQGAISPDFGHRELAEINAYTHPPGTFLNIGNDSMDILETARLKGWNSAAVAWIEEASSQQNNSVLQKGLRSLRYDVVRLENSLENSPEPVSFLQRISRLLRKDGLLVISTPDCTGWDFKLAGDGTHLFQNDLPCWFFTPRTMELLLQRAGFKVLKSSNFNMRFGPSTSKRSTSSPPDIAGDAPHGELLLPEANMNVRFFRVLARLDEAAQDLKKPRYNVEQQSKEISEALESGSLVFIE
ncbi:class I SAM-dependent methyltransferase [bacterium]|nr:class I SAM-dependent methyltransferase [bacterium]